MSDSLPVDPSRKLPANGSVALIVAALLLGGGGGAAGLSALGGKGDDRVELQLDSMRHEIVGKLDVISAKLDEHTRRIERLEDDKP